MQIKVGTDIIYVPKFKQILSKENEKFLDRIFLDQELATTPSAEHLAGMFAAKEAVIKTLGFPVGSWHQIVIRKDKIGHPFVDILKKQIIPHTSDLSISHDGKYAIAVFVAVM